MINDEITAAIKKALPEELGKTLKGELEELAKLRSESVEKDELILKNTGEIKNLKGKLVDLVSENKLMDLHDKDVTSREIILAEKEIETRIFEGVLAAKEDHCTDKITLMREMFRIPFANRILREDTLKVTQGGYVQQGNQFDQQSGSYDEHVIPTTETTPVVTTTEEA